MKLTEVAAPDFDLAMTLDSGQVFHWEKIEHGFCGAIGDRPVYAEQCGDSLRATKGCADLVRNYFALDHPLAKICASFPNDALMQAPLSLSYSHGTSTTPLLGETIGAILERAAAAHPGRDALVDLPSGRRWTYAEFNAEVDTVALGLLDLGIDKGDRVGLWAPNCPEWTLVQFATAKIGAILVNLNPAYRTHEVAYALNQSGCRLLISATEVKGSSYIDMVDSVKGTPKRSAARAASISPFAQLSPVSPTGASATGMATSWPSIVLRVRQSKESISMANWATLRLCR